MAMAALTSSTRPVVGGFRQLPKAAVPALPTRALSRRSLQVNAQYNRTPTSGAEANRKANEAADEASDKLQGYADDIQEWWENNDEKPTTIALGVAGFVALWATSGLLDAVNRLPLIGGVFEVVGLGVSGWFVYRYLGTADDRKDLKREFDSFLQKVGVKK
jgi:hypothetical protein